MNAFRATILAGLVLVALSVWAAADSGSLTALIPAAFGAALLAAAPGVKAENRIVAHVAVLLAVVVIVALVRPLIGTIDRGSLVGTARIGAMMLATLFALGCYVKSFVDARRSRS